MGFAWNRFSVFESFFYIFFACNFIAFKSRTTEITLWYSMIVWETNRKRYRFILKMHFHLFFYFSILSSYSVRDSLFVHGKFQYNNYMYNNGCRFDSFGFIRSDLKVNASIVQIQSRWSWPFFLYSQIFYPISLFSRLLPLLIFIYLLSFSFHYSIFSHEAMNHVIFCYYPYKQFTGI